MEPGLVPAPAVGARDVLPERVVEQPQPRLVDVVGVLAAYRRRGVATALLAAVFAELRRRGADEVVTEIDDENAASRALLEGLGARRTGTSVELLRRLSDPRPEGGANAER